MTNEELTKKIVDFLNSIGINVSEGNVNDDEILPGISIKGGALLYDKEKLTYPGDLLHEAGHLAVAPPETREKLSNDPESDAAQEMMTLAWAWAALVHLQLDPKVLFHDGGYHGDSDHIIMNFQGGHYVGLPMLQWLGMCADTEHAPQLGVKPFPHMIKWLRPDQPDE